MYDLIVIGAGPGGYEAALRAAELGMKTALVERREIGGTCLNRGCIPTKALLHMAQTVYDAQEAAAWGMPAEGFSIDMEKVYARKNEIVGALRGNVEDMLEAAGVDVFRGNGKILQEKRVEVTQGERVAMLEGKNILIATGSQPAKPPIEGLDSPGVVTSDELLTRLEELPESIIIIGGGVIGVEFATFFERMGSKVCILEGQSRLLPLMDKDLGQGMAQRLKKSGMTIVTDAMVSKITQGEGGLTVAYTRKGKPCEQTASLVLCAVGRTPVTDGLFGEGVAPEMNRRSIAVNDRFETSLSGIYAIGDVSSRIQLAHMATAQGINCVERLAGMELRYDLSVVPSCIFATPQIGAVGMTLEEAVAAGIEAVEARTVVTGNGRNVILGGERAMMKLVADAQTHRLLGAHIMCAEASEMLSQFTEAIANCMTVEQLMRVIHPHPTFEESIQGALRELKEKMDEAQT